MSLKEQLDNLLKEKQLYSKYNPHTEVVIKALEPLKDYAYVNYPNILNEAFVLDLYALLNGDNNSVPQVTYIESIKSNTVFL